MRVQRSIDIIPVLVAIGVTEKGYKLVLGLQSRDTRSAGSWRGFFKDLKSRGLDGQSVSPGHYGWVAGAGTVFKERVSPCQSPNVARCMSLP